MCNHQPRSCTPVSRSPWKGLTGNRNSSVPCTSAVMKFVVLSSRWCAMGISSSPASMYKTLPPVIPVGAHPTHASCTMARPVKFPNFPKFALSIWNK